MKQKDFSEIFEIGNDFPPAGLRALIQQGIETGKIFPLELEKAMPPKPHQGYQFNIELRLGAAERLVTFEYQEKEIVEGSCLYKNRYMSVPVGTLDLSLEEFDRIGFDLS